MLCLMGCWMVAPSQRRVCDIGALFGSDGAGGVEDRGGEFMKHLLKCLVVFGLIFIAASSLSARSDHVTQSTEIGSSVAVYTHRGLFHGIVVVTDGTYPVAVRIFDNATTNTGTELIPAWTVTTSATDRSQAMSIWPPVKFYKGIYLHLTCTGTVKAMVYYEK